MLRLCGSLLLFLRCGGLLRRRLLGGGLLSRGFLGGRGRGGSLRLRDTAGFGLVEDGWLVLDSRRLFRD